MAQENLYGPANEIELLLRIAEGDVTAFTMLYSKYYPRISVFANRFISDRDKARDITAETFIKWWRLRGKFDSIERLEGFLYVTTRNACLNTLRRSKKQARIEQELFYQLEASANEGILQRDIRAELLEAVFMEVQKLPEKYHEVFRLAFLQGLKNDEVAEQLRIANKTVRTYKSEILHLLRTAFDLKSLLLILPLLRN